MDQDIPLDAKEWLQQVKTPRDMSAQAFLSRLHRLNDLIEHMPIPIEGGDDDYRVPKLSQSELSSILRKSCVKPKFRQI
jgi:hypothetical protein